MPEPLVTGEEAPPLFSESEHRSLARIFNKFCNSLKLYYTQPAWSGLSNVKHYSAMELSEFIAGYSEIEDVDVNLAKLANAAFKFRQEIQLLKRKKEHRVNGLQDSPATLPLSSESRIALTATPTMEQLNVAVESRRITIWLICIIKLAVLKQLHVSKNARRKYPGIISLFTFSGIHTVGQYDALLSAIDRTCSCFFTICEATEGIDLNLRVDDPRYICAQLIELLTDVLLAITFDRELLRFGKILFNGVNQDYLLKSGISALRSDPAAMLGVTNVFYSWLYLLATETIRMQAIDMQYHYIDLAIELLTVEFAKISKQQDPEFIERFNVICAKFKAQAKPSVARGDALEYVVRHLEPGFKEDIFEFGSDAVNTASDGGFLDPHWGLVTPLAGCDEDYFTSTQPVEQTPVAKKEAFELSRSPRGSGLDGMGSLVSPLRSPRGVAAKVVLGV